MAHARPEDHLSDYERAVCYYSLPRTASPLTLGLVIAYAICLLEAVAAIGVGVYLDKPAWLEAGAYALVGLILFGMVAFTLRGFLSELRARKALAAAHGVPDARESAHDFPDPFEHHILLRHPSHARGTLYSLTDNHNTSGYDVEIGPNHNWWKIKDKQSGVEICVRVVSGARSFRIGGRIPAQAKVFRDEEEVAVLRRPLTLRDFEVEIEVFQPAPMVMQLRDRGLFVDNRLVGRVYNLRGSCYLDMDSRFFNDGILAYFVTMA